MKERSRFLLLSAFVLIFCSAVFPQKDNDLNKYKFRTLSEITMINREATDNILLKAKLEEKHDFIGSDLFYSRARVRFLGDSRPISLDHRDLIKTWAKLQNVDSKMVNLYENEFLFKDCDKAYWIPVQKNVSETLLKKVKLNEMISLFVVHVGGRKAAMSREYDWLFLSTAFEK